MKFSTPLALILLLMVPITLWWGWPRLRYRRLRDSIGLLLRLIILLLVIFSLAGLQLARAADRLAVVFLVDSSDSIDAAMQAQAEHFIREALQRIAPDDQAGVIVFGKNALVERPLSSYRELGTLASQPIRLDTDISKAIRLGLSMFPGDTGKRLVILSDGIQTTGNAMEAAQLAAATGVQIDFVALQRQSGPEVVVSKVDVPTTIDRGQLFDVNVTIDSQTDTQVLVTILAGGQTVLTRVQPVAQGTDTYTYTLTTPSEGFVDIQVRVDPIAEGADTFYQNNTLSSYTQVSGPPRILVVTSEPTEVATLLPVLQNNGFQVDVVSPSDLPNSAAMIASYKVVIMANVSATDLSIGKMRLLQTYVRDLGGGLVVIGGPNSYGVGGYFGTPLEETLPVEMQIKDQMRIPSLTMVYVIDRSGSMEVIGSSGVTNLELAKEATRRSLNFLFPRDRAGVLSFDSNPQWLVPLQAVNNRLAMASLIGQLRPGGGTDIFAAVQLIAKELPKDPSTIKHVILLTDGGADPTGIVQLVQQMRSQGITVTSIGIGTDVPQFMREIAVAGGGKYYQLGDLANIPQIFASETVLATRSYIVEREFTPNLATNNPIMRGITSLPTLLGYVGTTAKPTATVVLTAPGFNDPILATWQYGLGRAVAFTSDAAGRWGKNWVAWDAYQRFWSQVIRSTIVEGLDSALEVQVQNRNGQMVLVAQAQDGNGQYINGMNLDAVLVDPRGERTGIKLQQVAPGQYEAALDPQTEGAYLIRIAGSGGTGSASVAQTTGWVLSYSPEYRLQQADLTLLNDIANLTQGRSIGDRPETTFSHDLPKQQATTPLWPWLLLLATVLLPFDIAVRRVVVTRADWHKLRAFIRNRLGWHEHAQPAIPSARISVLREAKERATTGTTRVVEGVAPVEVDDAMAEATGQAPTVLSARIQTILPKLEDSSAEIAVANSTTSSPRSTTPETKEQSSESGTLAARLMDKKRKRD